MSWQRWQNKPKKIKLFDVPLRPKKRTSTLHHWWWDDSFIDCDYSEIRSTWPTKKIIKNIQIRISHLLQGGVVHGACTQKSLTIPLFFFPFKMSLWQLNKLITREQDSLAQPIFSQRSRQLGCCSQQNGASVLLHHVRRRNFFHFYKDWKILCRPDKEREGKGGRRGRPCYFYAFIQA